MVVEIESDTRRAAELWETNSIRIEYRPGSDTWALRARCMATGRPLEGWRFASYYTIGTARTLQGAVKIALRGPVRSAADLAKPVSVPRV